LQELSYLPKPCGYSCFLATPESLAYNPLSARVLYTQFRRELLGNRSLHFWFLLCKLAAFSFIPSLFSVSANYLASC
jgi:hypothetical protein